MLSYKPFFSENLAPIDMTVHRGEQIALLTPVADSNQYDSDILNKIVGAVDRAWNFYAEVTGREPTPVDGRNIDGLGTVAVVPETCGAGCGWLGETGIEITAQPYFDQFHGSVADRNEYDQAVFYELGRNFWFYEEQLGSLTPAVTGFAIANRFLSMEAAGVEGAPFNQQIPFNEFKASIMDGLSQSYFEDETLNWSNTVLTNNAPANPSGWNGSDFFASLIGRVHEDFGAQVYAEMWQSIGKAAATSDPHVATQIFINAASDASNIDYGFLLKEAGEMFIIGDANANDFTLRAPIANETVIGHGFAGNDTITGGIGDDLIFGGSGDDTINGGAGNDTIVGSEGHDTAVFRYGRKEYKIDVLEDGTVSIADLNGRDGADVLKNIESLVFEDETLDVAELSILENTGWTVSATDEAGTTWDGTKLYFTKQVPDDDGSGYDLTGYFDWKGSSGSYGEEPFLGELEGNELKLVGQSIVEPSQGLITGTYFGTLSQDGDEIANGYWTGDGGIPGEWSADLIV